MCLTKAVNNFHETRRDIIIALVMKKKKWTSFYFHVSNVSRKNRRELVTTHERS